jgi:hypothetical protein
MLRVPRYLLGHGIMEATSWNDVGYVNVPAACAMVTVPDRS